MFSDIINYVLKEEFKMNSIILYKKKAVSLLLCLVCLLFALCGCNENTEQLATEEVTNVQPTTSATEVVIPEMLKNLSDKYGEEFEVVNGDNPQSTNEVYSYYFSLRDNKTLLFLAQKYTDDNYFSDNYFERKIATKVRDLYFEVFSEDDTYAYFELDNKRSYKGENTNISFEEYDNFCSVKNISGIIILNKKSINSLSKCEEFISNMKNFQEKVNGTSLLMYLYIIPEKNYAECKGNFSTSAETPEMISENSEKVKEWLSKYGDVSSANLSLSDGEPSLSAKELLEKTKKTK